MKAKLLAAAFAGTLAITTARAAEPATPTVAATPPADDAAELAKKLSNPMHE